jgi:RNA polymerase sigma factor (sigma-70 family)
LRAGKRFTFLETGWPPVIVEIDYAIGRSPGRSGRAYGSLAVWAGLALGERSMEPGDLLQSVRKGDAQAATELYEWLAPRLLEYVRRRMSRSLSRRVDPEDIVQDTLFEIHRAVLEGEEPIRHLGRYSRAVARHMMYRVAQRKSGQFRQLGPAGGDERPSSTEAVPGGPGSPTQGDFEETRQLVEDALASLVPKQAEVVRLRLASGERRRKFKEIGEIVGLSAAAAEKTYLRAKGKIKAYIERRWPTTRA